MKVEVSRDLLVSGLSARLAKVGLSFIGHKGEYELVLMTDHPELFPEVARAVDTRDTQDLSP